MTHIPERKLVQHFANLPSMRHGSKHVTADVSTSFSQGNVQRGCECPQAMTSRPKPILCTGRKLPQQNPQARCQRHPHSKAPITKVIFCAPIGNGPQRRCCRRQWQWAATGPVTAAGSSKQQAAASSRQQKQGCHNPGADCDSQACGNALPFIATTKLSQPGCGL